MIHLINQLKLLINLPVFTWLITLALTALVIKHSSLIIFSHGEHVTDAFAFVMSFIGIYISTSKTLIFFFR